jgi:3-oxoacyl-[acyl-carrier protein] reductase
MSDMLLELGRNPNARRLLKGLPIPLPESLRREPGAMRARPLQDRKVVVGGEGQLLAAIAETLAPAGADVFTTNLKPFVAPGETYGRPPRSEIPERIDAIVFDATSLASLRPVFDFFQPLVKKLSRSARVVVLTRGAADPYQAALEGFVRSLAKEIGRNGSTANLLVVTEGAETRVAPVLRFVLSSKSAFVTAQPIAIDTRAPGANEPTLVRSLEKRVALVTGAARGIGAATARALADEGAHVICLDRPADDTATSQLAREIGGRALLLDLTADDAPAKLAALGPIDIVVHNAGVTRDKTLARMSAEQWDQVIGVNLDAVIRAHNALQIKDRGRVICLSSIAGLAGNMGQTAYAASKAGIVGFVNREAARLAARGITVNAIAPGFIETRLTAAIPFAIREVARRLAALGQGGLPEDVASAIAFLATPGSQGITGATLRVCGGAFVGR